MRRCRFQQGGFRARFQKGCARRDFWMTETARDPASFCLQGGGAQKMGPVGTDNSPVANQASFSWCSRMTGGGMSSSASGMTSRECDALRVASHLQEALATARECRSDSLCRLLELACRQLDEDLRLSPTQ